ncbi:MAG: oligosaccharide flippase family protein [Paracoccaceae bacterium]
MDRRTDAARDEACKLSRATVFLGFWSLLLQWGRFGIAAVVFLVIARWLSLAEIGAFAIAAAPVRFLQVVHRNGIGEAVILARNGSMPVRDTDALFALSLLAAVASISVLLMAVEAVQRFGDAIQPVGPMMASLSLVALFNGISAVSEGLLRQRLRIKALAIRTLTVQVAAALAAICAARLGAGPWSLVLFLLLNAALGSVTALLLARWRPLGWPHISDLLRVAPNFAALSGQALVGNALQPLFQLGVGISLGLADAGAFQIAWRFLGLLDTIAVAPLRFLALPLLSAKAKTPDQMGAALIRGLQLTGLAIPLVYFGAAAVAPDILSVFIGSGHAGASVELLQILCLSGLASAMSMVPVQAMIASGDARLVLWRNISNLVLAILFAWGTSWHSASAVAASITSASIVIMISVFALVPRRYGLGTGQALRAVLAPGLAGLIMALTVYWIAAFGVVERLPDGLALAVLVVIGTLLYGIFTSLFAKSACDELRRAIAGTEAA